MSSTSGWAEGMRARLEAVLSGEAEVVTPRDATTVVIVRDAPDGLEVFLMQRASSMKFAANAHVFPGGGLDEGDYDAAIDISAEWVEPLGAHDVSHAKALVACGIRETLEEAGLVLTASEIYPWAHWITPEVEWRRFDTRFLVAVLPEGQTASQASAESVSGHWWKPTDALAEAYADRIILMPPTLATLEELKALATTAEVIAHAKSKEISTILPRLIIEGDQIKILHRGMPGYDEAIPSKR